MSVICKHESCLWLFHWKICNFEFAIFYYLKCGGSSTLCKADILLVLRHNFIYEILCWALSVWVWLMASLASMVWNYVYGRSSLLYICLTAREPISFSLLDAVITYYMDYLFVQIFHKRMPPEAIDLASRLLQYSPSLRCTAVSWDLLYFDEIS